MNPRLSLYLDFLRFSAAILVFVSHFAYTRFTGGDYIIIRDLNLGSDAVVFFFVLSGLVISYTAEVKDKTLKDYSFNRLTRLFSVIVPALLLTILLDQGGRSIEPMNYDGWWYQDASVLEQFFRGLSLTYQWAFQDFRIGTNGPLWSLSYEVAYYILFGIVYYITGMKRWLLLLFLIPFFGVSVILLLPAWLLGVWAYHKIKQEALSPMLSWVFAVLPPAIYVLSLWLKVPMILLGLTKIVLGEDFVNVSLHFSDEFLWNIFISQLIAFHLIGVSSLCRHSAGEVKGKFPTFIRWCAGATFTIYLVHYPAFQFVDSVLPENWSALTRHGTLFVSVLLGCLLFAEISERRLKFFRAIFKR